MYKRKIVVLECSQKVCNYFKNQKHVFTHLETLKVLQTKDIQKMGQLH